MVRRWGEGRRGGDDDDDDDDDRGRDHDDNLGGGITYTLLLRIRACRQASIGGMEVWYLWWYGTYGIIFDVWVHFLDSVT
jgi:hypothetical protein